jgi:putative Ca2+/H+ antiporter (TMEM165/GDT1 family)
VEAFLVCLSSVAVAEIGDRTQLLALLLAARYRRPWLIAAAVLCATLANHALAGIIGVWLGQRLTPPLLDGAVGLSLLAMGLWSLKGEPETGVQVGGGSRTGAFAATFTAFFLAEMGDKTQLATMALAAAYHDLILVIGGSTCGMMLANVPVIFLGNVFANRLPLRLIHYVAGMIFTALGILFIVRALRQ